jgi:hypothetical protein
MHWKRCWALSIRERGLNKEKKNDEELQEINAERERAKTL